MFFLDNNLYFPTCQMRLLDLIKSDLPPPPLPPPPISPRPCLHQFPRPLPPCQLFANLFANFCAQWTLLDLNCRLRSEWARLDLNRKVLTAVGTAGSHSGTFRAQWAPLGLNLGPSELRPQPGTFRAQWPPLDLNLGPSELSGHRWTSTAR